jgi:phospholipid/cholesterol/gamma-HCH transport system ATP-binding protein
MSDSRGNAEAHIEIRDLSMSYGDFVIQKNLNYRPPRRHLHRIMGGSGCGKSTLLKVLIEDLKSPSAGDVSYENEAFWAAGTDVRKG